MCAADVKVAAPDARIYDYPFLGVPNSGGALQMFQAVLDQRLRDGTPHITNNSYGFTGVPDPVTFPNHEVNDINHPLHRKVREVIAAGVACLFAAGNCGHHCPSGNCQASGTGPGKSIHASNSLAEVITVAAVNNARDRIGYSSQGPGMFERQKPDIASYSHIFGNFGPGRPGGTVMPDGRIQPFDNGTSAATPVAAGVAAMLLSAFPGLTPAQIKDVLIRTAIGAGGWNADFGHGIIDADAAYNFLKTSPPPPIV
jgi:serine protease AprX